MLSNFSQYSPQGFIPQFPGLQGAGWPQMSPGLFGQPGAYAGFVPFAHEPALAGLYPTPFLQNPFVPSPFAPSPLAYNPLPGSFAGFAGAHHPAQQIVLVLGQLAQQISVQTAMTQQISIAAHTVDSPPRPRHGAPIARRPFNSTQAVCLGAAP